MEPPIIVPMPPVAEGCALPWDAPTATPVADIAAARQATFAVDGKTLWSYKWDSHFIWPTMAAADNGQRVAFSTLRVARPLSSIDPFDESELQGQRIEVLDVESGRLDLTEFATPMLSGGQNYTLSPDGNRFAVLRENAIEIYDLPPSPPVLAAASRTAE